MLQFNIKLTTFSKTEVNIFSTDATNSKSKQVPNINLHAFCYFANKSEVN